MLTERSFRCKNKRQLLKQQHDYAKMKKLGLDHSLLKMNEQLIVQIEKQISLLEEQIEQIIGQDEPLNSRLL
jgi:transposase